MTYEPYSHPGCLGCASREATITSLRAQLAECKKLLAAEIARHDALSDDVFNTCKSDERVLAPYNKEWARHRAECKKFTERKCACQDSKLDKSEGQNLSRDVGET